MDGNAATPRLLAQSLDLVAEDLAELVGLGERVQGVISRMAAAAPRPRDAGLLMDAQAADLLSQRLAGLTAFVRALAEAEHRDDPAAVEAAVRTLTLAEQARRLAGGAPSPAAQPDAGGHPTFWD
jgi:hypothetical protein